MKVRISNVYSGQFAIKTWKFEFLMFIAVNLRLSLTIVFTKEALDLHRRLEGKQASLGNCIQLCVLYTVHCTLFTVHSTYQQSCLTMLWHIYAIFSFNILVLFIFLIPLPSPLYPYTFPWTFSVVFKIHWQGRRRGLALGAQLLVYVQWCTPLKKKISTKSIFICFNLPG